MAKRLFAFVLALAMIVSLMPQVSISVNAVEPIAPGASEWCNHTSHDGWTAITKATGLPSDAGKYYLDEDIELTAQWTVSHDIHLCLNGHKIEQKTSGARLIYLNEGKGATLSVYDCDGKGTITGGSNATGSCVNVTRTSTFSLYGGTITGNNNSSGKGVIYIQQANTTYKTGGTFNMYGGTITGNTVKSGGAVCMVGAAGASGYTNAQFNMYGGTISSNTANGTGTDEGGGAINVTGYGVVNLQGGTISGNSSKNGTAIYAKNATVTIGKAEISGHTNNSGDGTIFANACTVTIDGATIKNNTAKSGGAIYVSGAGSLVIANATITGNKATTAGSAIYAQNQTPIAITDTTITGNTGTSTHKDSQANGWTAAVYVCGVGNVLTLSGKVVISGNTTKYADTADISLNHADNNKLYVKDLAEESNIVFRPMKADAQTADAAIALVSGANQSSWKDGWVTYMDANGETKNVAYGDNNGTTEFFFGQTPAPQPPAPTHAAHKLCNDASCTAHGEAVTFDAWGDDAEETGLPTQGNWYLTANVEVDNVTTVGGDLNLCLNGKTITQTTNNRIYNVAQGKKLNITDCAQAYTDGAYTGGKLTGGRNNTGSGIYVYEGAVFSLYGGRITDCKPVATTEQSGAAVYLRATSAAGATFNMYGGEITGNGGANCWGGAVTNGGGNTTNTVYVNIYGGKIFDNTVLTGGAIRMRNAAVVTVSGGEIYENEAKKSGGAIYLDGTAKLVLQGGNIHDNTAAVTGAGIYMPTAATLEVSGAPVVNNNKVSGNQHNLYLGGNAVFTVGQLTSGADIGLSRAATRDSDVVSANTVTDAQLAFFSSDSDTYEQKLEGGKLALVEKTQTPVNPHDHKLCNDTACGDHVDVEFQAWDKKDSLPESGDWYLVYDVELTANAAPTGNLRLCLNGKTVKQTTANNRVLRVNEGLTVTITDCSTEKTGTLTNGQATYGAAVSVRKGSTFNLYGGKITGNVREHYQAEGTVYIQSATADYAGGIFNMYGGEISGNKVSRGGAVSIADSKTNANPAQFNMYGGVISNNEVVEITEGTKKYGGSGGGVFASGSGIINIAGGQITGNTAQNYGAAIYIPATATLTVSGTPVVNNNKIGGNQHNLYLAGNAVFTVGQLTSGADIGLSRAATRDSAVVSTNTVTDAQMAFFSSDSGEYVLGLDDAGYLLLDTKPEVSDHPHKLCNDASCAEHADVPFLPWGDDAEETGLPTAGNYYLTKDVELNGAADITGNLNLCLNGKNIKQTKANSRVLNISGGANVSITDCKATGTITGGTGTYGAAISVRINSTLNWYGGKITDNIREHYQAEGTVYIQSATATAAGGIFNMYGGEISGNKVSRGGAVSIADSETNANPAQFNMYGGEIKKNESVIVVTTDAEGNAENNGGFGGAVQASGVAIVNIQGGAITGNTAQIHGGAIYMAGKGSITVQNAEISGNTAKSEGGAVYSSNGAQILIKNTQIKENTAKNGSAIAVYGGGLTLDGAKIEGNHATNGYGAVNANHKSGNEITVILKGATTITGNTAGTAKNAQNLILRKSSVGMFYDVSGLTDGAKIGMTKEKGREQERISAAALGSAAELSRFVSDDVNFKAAQDEEGYLILAVNTDHIHNVCNNAACAEHADVPFMKWTKTDSLPTSGNYYLTADVQLSEAYYNNYKISDTLNLCLNGHDVTAYEGKRVMMVAKNGVLNLTDCSSTPGMLTGGTATWGAAINVNVDGTFNMYGGKISGNKNTAADGGVGAIYIQGAGATFNMYGGEISGNESVAGAIYAPSIADDAKKAQINIYGGTICNNKAITAKNSKDETVGGSGAAISASKNTLVNISGGQIKDNTAEKYAGGVFITGNGTVLTMTGGEISGNTAANGAGVMVQTRSVFNLQGGKITGNTATGDGGAIYVSTTTTLNMTGGQISGNQGRSGGGIYGYKSNVNLLGGQITGNTATRNGGGVTGSGDDKADVAIKIGGTVQITDNKVGGKLNNLYLSDDRVIVVEDMKDTAKIGVSVNKLFRAISEKTNQDYTAYFVSDSSYKVITYKDGALYIGAAEAHDHCVCDSNSTGCDHTKQSWEPWESNTTLPTSGTYYLTADVQLSSAYYNNYKISGELNLCLNGHTVTACEGKRVMMVANGGVLNLTDCNEKPGMLTGGTQAWGAAVNVNVGGTFNLFGGKISGNKNTAVEGGVGAIYLQGSESVFNMYGGEISGNEGVTGTIYSPNIKVDAKPAQINLYGGTICDNKVITVKDSDDKNVGGRGGAIYASRNTKVTIYDGVIKNNDAEVYGGAIFATGEATVVTLNSGELKGNYAGSAGGAIMLQNRSAMTMNGGKITENADGKNGGAGLYVSTNTQFTMNGGEFSGNKGTGHGAAINMLRSKVVINDGLIQNNETAGRAAVMISGAEVILNKVTIKDNVAKEAGAMYINRNSATNDRNEVTYYPATVEINDGVVITGNKADSNCGGIITANEGVVVTMNGGEISRNVSKNGAGVMTWNGSTFIMKGGNITKHTVTSSGGAVYVSTGSTFKMQGGTISNNKAASGGGIYLLRSTGEFTGGTIANNYATKTAGAMYISGAKVNLRGTTITGNGTDKNGGGIVLGRATINTNGVKTYENASLNIYGGLVSGNYATNGGGMLIQSSGTVVNMYGGTFTNNKASAGGGGIYVSSKTEFNMTGGAVINNTADSNGAGIYCLKSTVNITGGQLNSNTAVANSSNLMVNGDTCVVNVKNMKIYGGESKNGGAIVAQGKGTLNMENCEIYGNKTVTGHGGAVYISNNSFGNFTNCKFFDNEAAGFGGAVMVNNYGNSSFTKCEFTDNHAVKQGGALWVSVVSNNTVTDSRFAKNSAEDRGGAITCKGDMIIKNTVVEENTAVNDGGGIYTDVNATTGSGIRKGLAVENSKIRNNTAGLQGGGMFIHKGCRVELYDTEITGNKATAEGGGIWAYEDLQLHSATITGNTSGGEGYALYMNDANYDGHSYFTSRNKLSGDTIVKDNNGGDMWMGPDVVMVITADGLGQNAHIELTLDSGVVTNRLFGAYHYEGGNQVYTITYGDRSVTDPEYDAELTAGENEKTQSGATDVLLYAGVGVLVIAVAAVAVLVILKKKKAGKTAEKVNKE